MQVSEKSALTIKSQAHPYSVLTAATLREAIGAASKTGTPYYLVDRNLKALYPADLAGISELGEARTHWLNATEEEKSYDRLTPLFEWLLKSGFRKDSNLVVIGGGVTQDIGCFLASVLFRGSRWELIPTTLLAQCDSCIGSKSSINIGAFKNQIGTFYPPHAVHLTASVLKTLPHDEIRSGIGEMIKLALIAGEPALSKLRENLIRFEKTPQDYSILEVMILDSMRIKKPYIEEDEFDRGRRNLLNYGHTFGHAFESATHYGVPHGIAVSLGMAAATFFSERLGLAPDGHSDGVRALLAPYFRPYESKLASLGPELILAAMKHDKKNTQGKINCILTRGPGKMEKTPLTAEQIEPLLRDFLKGLTP